MKLPKCKICGGPHYKYQCFQNPKRKYALKRKYSRFKAGLTPRADKVLSKQNLDRKRLIVDLDKYCSLYVRVNYADKHGIVTCYTCGKRLPWKMSDNGHYKSRQFVGTRFDFDNMRPQCQNCNRTLRGNLAKYKEHLVKEIGETRVNELNIKKTRKISTVELEEMLKDIKTKYKKLVEKKKSEQIR